MKTCYVCGKFSKIQELVWENGKPILKERCCNPCCGTYRPYVLWKWQPNRIIGGKIMAFKTGKNACPVCSKGTCIYRSYSDDYRIVEQHGYCTQCGYTIEQAYSEEMEFFIDIKKGFKLQNGEYVRENVRKHKRARRKTKNR